ncbi:MAG TPA: GAF domain-containing SpoIIE family protein phosphatase, partial [Acidimicrobiales bacterium]|nr:GAF domain-containing SpoIIE family protein phosphatase [Acidimicrobiales bacterium]
TGDVLSETRFKSNQIILDIGIRSAATAVVDGPGGTPWGILGVHSASVDAFSEEDIYVLSVIANVLGAALIRTHTEDTREAMRQLEREARERLEFLARSSDVLSQSLDVDQTMHGLAKLAIERFADWCAIELVDELGRSSSIVVAHADPSRVEMARELRERYPPNPAAETGPPAVVRSGRPELYRDVPLELLEATAQDAEHLRLLQSLGLRSAMIVPLVSRTRRVLGTASFVSSESERIFDADDLALATELGRRAGLAVENAQLFGERDYVARALQASLLPPARPVIHGLELSAIYRPAAAGPVIGGDFYDFFESDDGAWSIVIGDVCGKGADAAALTGLARHTIRAASMREASPAAVLADLNEVLLRDDTTQRFCTVALARLERHADGFSMISSCGGHPAPVVVRGDGRVEPTACQGSLIGILHEVELVDTTVELNPGDVVVLYTDGVTEARVRNEVFGEEGLLSLLAGFGPRHPDEVAAAIHEAVVLPDGGGTRDDVAIVVLRVSGVPAEAPGGPALDAPGVVAANA